MTGDGGYRDAFYELARMMDIGARPHSPKVTWEREMKPRLQAALAMQSQAPNGEAVDCDVVGLTNEGLIERARAWPGGGRDALSASYVGALLNELSRRLEVKSPNGEAVSISAEDAQRLMDRGLLHYTDSGWVVGDLWADYLKAPATPEVEL